MLALRTNVAGSRELRYRKPRPSYCLEPALVARRGTPQQNEDMDPKLLREATRAEHERTEGAMPLLGPDLTRERYVHVLRCLYPIVRGWEQWAAKNAPEPLQDAVTARRRTGLLEQDLRFFNEQPEVAHAFAFNVGSIPGLAITQAPGDLGDHFKAAFLGAMYVIEGSTLGGQYISKQVEASLGLVPGEGDAYFRGYRQNTGPMWKQVQAELAALPDDLNETVVGAAKAMFNLFHDAMQGCIPA